MPETSALNPNCFAVSFARRLGDVISQRNFLSISKMSLRWHLWLEMKGKSDTIAKNTADAIVMRCASLQFADEMYVPMGAKSTATGTVDIQTELKQQKSIPFTSVAYYVPGGWTIQSYSPGMVGQTLVDNMNVGELLFLCRGMLRLFGVRWEPIDRGPTYAFDLSNGWNWTFGERLFLHNQPDEVIRYSESGNWFKFKRENDGSYTPGSYSDEELTLSGHYPTYTYEELSKNGSEWILKIRDKDETILTFDSTGLLKNRTQTQGRSVTIARENGTLCRLESTIWALDGVTIETNPAGHITKILDRWGRGISIAYDEYEHLQQIQHDLGAICSYSYAQEAEPANDFVEDPILKMELKRELEGNTILPPLTMIILNKPDCLPPEAKYLGYRAVTLMHEMNHVLNLLCDRSVEFDTETEISQKVNSSGLELFVSEFRGYRVAEDRILSKFVGPTPILQNATPAELEEAQRNSNSEALKQHILDNYAEIRVRYTENRDNAQVQIDDYVSRHVAGLKNIAGNTDNDYRSPSKAFY